MQRSRSSSTVGGLPRRSRGFTLIESMLVVGIAGVLSSIAYPSLEGHVLRARRTDALVVLMQAQLGQERFRANSTRYGNAAEIGLRSSSPAGYYNVEVRGNDAETFDVLASAVGQQTRDTACRHMRVALGTGGLAYASGPDTSTANAAPANRKCWNQ